MRRPAPLVVDLSLGCTLVAFVGTGNAQPSPDALGELQVLTVLARYTEPAPFSRAQAESDFVAVAAWFQENSWDARAGADTARTTMAFDFGGWYTLTAPSGLRSDSLDFGRALTEAAADGIDVTSYDRLAFLFADTNASGEIAQFASTIPATFRSFADSGQAGWFPSFQSNYASYFYASAATLGDKCHELTHTLGMGHSPSRSSISTNIHPYGNSNDTMGDHTLKWFPHTGLETAPHVNASAKALFGWMESPDTVSATGTYFVTPLESALGDVGSNHHALKILGIMDDPYITVQRRFFFLEFRRPFGFDDVASVDTAYVFNQHYGALINEGFDNRSYSFAIDCTPETPMHQIFDGALMVGRSYTNTEAGVCISAVGIEEDTLEVNVTFLDDYPNNRAPTVHIVAVAVDSSGADYVVDFSAVATDPDGGDQLLYFWNFEIDWFETFHTDTTGQTVDQVLTAQLYKPGTFGSGQQVSHAFLSDSSRAVYLKVSDQKGGETDWFEIPLWGWARDTVFVGPEPGDAATIDAAVAAATDGDVVVLRASGSPFQGSGNRDVSLRSKRIAVRGEVDTVTIDLEHSGRAFVCDGYETQWTVIEDLTIKNGRDVQVGRGGALFCSRYARPVIRGVTFIDCEASDPTLGTGEGGAVYADEQSQPTLDACRFVNCQAVNGGAVYGKSEFVGNGSILREVTDGRGGLTMRGCVFEVNGATNGNGGAVYYEEEGPYNAFVRRRNSDFALVSSVFVGNNAAGYGGSVYTHGLRKYATIAGNTFVTNLGVGDGGHSWFFDDPVDTTHIASCIFWPDTSLITPGPYNAQLATWDLADSSMVSVRNSRIADWWDMSNGNISSDPGFVLAPENQQWNLNLGPYSPCIDSGVLRTSLLTTDAIGASRFDDASVENTGAGLVDFCDMGALERTTDSGTIVSVGHDHAKEARSVTVDAATYFECGTQLLHVGRFVAGNTTTKFRTFFDFDTSAIPDSAVIDRVRFAGRVYDGTGYALEIREKPDSKAQSHTGGGSGPTSPCGQLFASVSGSTLYLTTSDWSVAPGDTVVVDLGSVAAADLQDLLTADWFTVGAKFANEGSGFEDTMEFYNSGNALYVTYTVP